MIILFALFLLSLLVVTALAIVRTENLFVAVMLTSIFSLLMAANFFILDAADVALTEAAVGAGVTTVIFLGALALTAEREKFAAARGRVAAVVVAILTALIIYATFDKPRLGDPDAPVHQHLAPWYLEKTPELIDIPNVVTAVLGTFRGYDTLGEVFVVFAACIGVLFILGVHPKGAQTAAVQPSSGLRHHLIPQVVGRLLIPFIILFGLYVQFHGEYGPGGGFQAGALIATGIILYALLEGEAAALKVLPRSVLMGLVIGGACLYGGVGLLCILMGGNFLEYSVLASNPVTGQQVGILLIEGGVGMAVCGALLSIFHAFAARPVYS
ncbi:multisubunit sodium/proton antiporter, MrpB subunit (TC 2.A.63.1) [Alteromonadaceae bacterium Bs31]|nr:multisubunit sodium/proton antiporter, MrpB subunit (TC 2.A.63.1) [Alteromonadaceae bacterium Bs31]